MCLFTKWKFPRIAWKPIKVIKFLNLKEDGYHSIFFDSGPIKGKIMECKDFELYSSQMLSFYYEHYRIINKAIHSYCNDHPMFNYTQVQAIIPRFSLYYKNCNGTEYASNRLKLLI